MNKTVLMLAILAIILLVSGCVEQSAEKISASSKQKVEMRIMANNPMENVKIIVIDFELPANAKIESVILPGDIKISSKELFLYEKASFIKGAESVQLKVEVKNNSGKIGIFWKEKAVNGLLATITLSGTEKFPTKVLTQGINDKREKIGLNVESEVIS